MEGKMGFLRIAGAVMLATAMGCLAGCGGSSGTKSIVVADCTNNRVMVFPDAFTTDESATVVLGQANATSNLFNQGLAAPTASTLGNPYGVSELISGKDKGLLIVADANNCRVVAYKPPFTTGMAATSVIGEPNLTTANCLIGATATATSLFGPTSSVADSKGNLWVADVDDNRVLMYSNIKGDGTDAAAVVLGQTTTAGTGTFGCNRGGVAPTAATVCEPWTVSLDSAGDLWVTDGDNSRVLEYVPVAGVFTTGQAASLVLGQAGPGTNIPGDTASTLDFPVAAAFDAHGNLWVADEDNSRVLEFVPPFATGMSASLVLGQTKVDGTGTSGCNQGLAAPTAATLCDPAGLSFESNGDLVVSDEANQRVLTYKPPFATGMSATLVFGHSVFTTGAVEATNPAANTFWNPIGLLSYR
jgi:hypothetical protein